MELTEIVAAIFRFAPIYFEDELERLKQSLKSY